jgi:hypothetical protein
MEKGYYNGMASPLPDAAMGNKSPTQASLEWGTRNRKLKISDFRLRSPKGCGCGRWGIPLAADF